MFGAGETPAPIPITCMKITESHYINATPDQALDAAERWLYNEAPQLESERGSTPGGLPYVGLDQLVDGISIETRFIAEQQGDGTLLTFHLRMRGESFLGKIRNLGMLPARKHVRNAAIEQFQQIIDELEHPTGDIS